MTSYSSYKHSVLFSAMMLALPVLSVHAADYVIVEGTQYANGKYAGIYQPNKDFEEDVTITTGTQPEGHLMIFGVVVDKDITFKRNVSIDANATADGATAYGFRAVGGEVSILGNTTIHTSSKKSIGDDAYSVGVLANNSTLDMSTGLTSITIDSDSGRTFGFQIVGGSKETKISVGKTDVNINIHDSSAKLRWVEGIFGSKSSFVANDTVTVSIAARDDRNEYINLDKTGIHGITLEGSAYNTNAHFIKDFNINLDVSSNYEIMGAYVSGDYNSSIQLNSGLEIDGTVRVDITQAGNGGVVGLFAQGESEIKADKAVISVNSISNATTYGIQAATTPSSYPGPGAICIDNGVAITLSGNGDQIGIDSRGSYDNRGSSVNIGGTSYLAVTSRLGDASGISVTLGAVSSMSDVTLLVESNSQNSSNTAMGFNVVGGVLDLNGTNTATAKGLTSIGMNVNGAEVNINGSLALTGNTALSATDQSSKITVQGNDDQFGALVLHGNVSNEGTISLNKAELTVSDITQDAKLGSIEANDSTVSVGAGKYEIVSFTGRNKTLSFSDLANNQGVNFAQAVDSMTLVAEGTSNDQYATPQEAAAALVDAFTVGGQEVQSANDIVVEQGLVNDGLKGKRTADGYTVTGITKNTFVESASSVNALSTLSWRHEMDSLNKRMGELRDSPNGIGSWARIYGSEMEYGTNSVLSKNTTLQVGSDVSAGDWKFGIAAHYTDGESEFDNGSADTKNYGVALYGIWLAPCGGYLDLVAKYSRLDNDFTLSNHTGAYDNNAISVSAEVGHKFKFAEDRVFVEPQIELTYGYVTSADFSTNDGIRIEQDSYESLIGRIGVRTGFTFPDNKGSVYARISGNYDFKGEMNARYYGGKGFNTSYEDLGGSWVEYGIGANFNWTENTYTYVDLERTSGGEVKENYRWNVGLRHVF